MSRKPSGGGHEPPSLTEPIGYGRPPKHAQFKPGQSGNPAGRPKGRRNLKTELIEELNEPVEITEKGVKTKVTKLRALVKCCVAKAANGDARMLAMLIDKLFTLDASPDPSSNEESDPSDEAILKRYGIQPSATLVDRENSDE